MTSVGGRRPSFHSGATGPLQAREQLVLSLFGETHTLMEDLDGYRPHRGGPALLLTDESDHWQLHDEAGRIYRFETLPGLGASFWVLTSIADPSGRSTVDLHYDVGTLAVGDDGGLATTLELAEVEYNHGWEGYGDPLSSVLEDPSNPPPPSTPRCAKHVVTLRHTAGASPLSLTVMDDFVMARASVIDGIDVKARGTCPGNLEIVRSYSFGYQLDGDNGLPRLAQVSMSGRQGSPEENVLLPVATYHYGTASREVPGSSVGRELAFERATTMLLPAGLVDPLLGESVRDPSLEMPDSLGIGNTEYASLRALQDFTGDGRADWVYASGGSLWLSTNQPHELTLGGFWSSGPIGEPGSEDLGAPSLSIQALLHERREYGEATNPGSLSGFNVNDTWRQVIDMNGDGRLDIVDASQKTDTWVVYLNTPGATAETILWKRQLIDAEPFRDYLEARGHLVLDDYVPLGRKTSGRSITRYRCYRYLNGWSESTDPACASLLPPTEYHDEKTITEWELRDFNGDGFVDIVSNSNPVQVSYVPAALDTTLPQNSLGAWAERTVVDIAQREGNTLDVAFDVAGVLRSCGPLDPHDGRCLAARYSLQSIEATSCGVERWSGGAQQRQVCGSQDINGDGVPDRIEEATARLSNGSSFSSVTVSLPGQPWQETWGYCDAAPQSQRHSWQSSGFLDVTADGIADFVEYDVHPDPPYDPVWLVHAGTGAGFAPPIPMPGFAGLPSTLEACSGDDGHTWDDAGVVDVDGDGRVDSLVAEGGSFGVFRLRGSEGTFGAPEAGRLVAIEDGFGKTISVRYRSAKRDPLTPHQVPFPEIVVASVETAGSGSTGIAPTHYAYGDASTHYDPLSDRWIWSGYGRTIELRGEGSLEGGVGGLEGTAQIRDEQADAPVPGGSVDARVGRYLLAGTTRDETLLVGWFSDPWSLLDVDPATDLRARAATHTEHATRRVMTTGAVNTTDDCLDIQDPYDMAIDLTSSPVLLCQHRVFEFASSRASWRGDEAPPSDRAVSTRTDVLDVDTFGRTTAVHLHNDVQVADDDLCVDTVYAQPNGSEVRSAVASTTVSACGGGVDHPRVLSRERMEYDDLPEGQVSRGWPTASRVERYDVSSGAMLDIIEGASIGYDFVGNPVAVSLQRSGDGASRKTRYTYDAFRLTRLEERVTATGAAELTNTLSLDPVAMIPLSAQDPRGLVTGIAVDGFGRVTRRTVTPPGGVLGVVEATEYVGFDGAPGGRTIVRTRYADPIPDSQVGTTPGQTETTSLDALGRVVRTSIGLGADYGGASMVVVDRAFDSLGRVMFEAEPYPATETTDHYGTTRHYDAQGLPTCFVRGFGVQPLVGATNLSAERFPTCVSTSYAQYRAILSTESASALEVGNPEVGVVRIVEKTAIGRDQLRSTWQGTTPLERITFRHDALGHVAAMTRYQDPTTSSAPVEVRRVYDSLGRVLWSEEGVDARVHYQYDDWSALVRTSFVDAAAPPVAHDIMTTYDGLGRPLSRVELIDGNVDADTTQAYAYDFSSGDPDHIGADGLLGRLAFAKGSTGMTYFGYDPWGRPRVRSFVDPQGELYVQWSEQRYDGAPMSLSFWLPDTGHDEETVDYQYDSAGRVVAADYSDRDGVMPLLGSVHYDVFGRMLEGKYGHAIRLEAEFAATGRRLPTVTRLIGATDMRRIEHAAYDAAGRETVRLESLGANATIREELHYDALGRLDHRMHDEGQGLYPERFAYDPLGNRTMQDDVASGTSTQISMRADDPDRICRVVYDAPMVDPTVCNVQHDALGRVTVMPTPSGDRLTEYFADGHVRRVALGKATATYLYDPLGAIAQLDVVGGEEALERRDRRFGSLIERRDEIGNGVHQSFIERKVPGVGGMTVSRRGTGLDTKWVFGAAEPRGGRFFLDENGDFIQDQRYSAFGQPTSTGTSPGERSFTTSQWNGGDRLEALGVSQLGERLYDPRLGRFQSRDPLLIPRTAATTNPYAFAMNDPWNASDPSGLDPLCDAGSCDPPSIGGGLGIFIEVWRRATRGGQGRTIDTTKKSPPKVHSLTSIGPYHTASTEDSMYCEQGWVACTVAQGAIQNGHFLGVDPKTLGESLDLAWDLTRTRMETAKERSSVDYRNWRQYKDSYDRVLEFANTVRIYDPDNQWRFTYPDDVDGASIEQALDIYGEQMVKAWIRYKSSANYVFTIYRIRRSLAEAAEDPAAQLIPPARALLLDATSRYFGIER
ncbi:MAG: RHS repeat-associated core domain-containing protein [Polyangiaceae bacterium]